MNPLLIRRRGMMMAAAVTPPVLLYQNSEPITSSTDTGVKLFDPPISFTILMDATFNNYNWTTAQGIIGLSYNTRRFRIGRVSDGEGFVSGVSQGTGNYYTALSLNDSGYACTGLYSRYNGNLRRKFAVKYDATTHKVFAFGPPNTYIGDRWYYLSANPENTYTVELLVGNAGGTVHDVQIYQGLMSETDMLAYMQN